MIVVIEQDGVFPLRKRLNKLSAVSHQRSDLPHPPTSSPPGGEGETSGHQVPLHRMERGFRGEVNHPVGRNQRHLNASYPPVRPQTTQGGGI
jgi:hypothetical protein